MRHEKRELIKTCFPTSPTSERCLITNIYLITTLRSRLLSVNFPIGEEIHQNVCHAWNGILSYYAAHCDAFNNVVNAFMPLYLIMKNII